jgi:ClpX C4-type zinc finger protein
VNDFTSCSFCGKTSDEVGRLFQGPGVRICDGCVRVCYKILEQVEAAPPPALDPLMAEIADAQKAALAGDKTTAREQFAAIWEKALEPMHQVALAHYMADAQDDPEIELEWDVRALTAADTADPSAVRGRYASLYANLAADHEKLGDPDKARHYLALAEAAVPDLPPDGYGELIRSTIATLKSRLHPE